MKLKQFATALAVCLGAFSTYSHGAATVNQVLVPGINEFQDTDAERVLRDGVAVTSGLYQVGDIFQTILRFDTVNAFGIIDLIEANGGPLPNSYQLTAYSELQIAAFEDVPTLGAGSCAATGFCRFVFAPSGNLLDPNSFADLYERDPAVAGNAFSLTAAPATAIAQLLAQTHIASVGLSDGDDFWYADSLLDIGAAAALTEGSAQQAAGVFGLSVLLNPGMIPVQPNGIVSGAEGTFHDVVGNVSAYQRSPGVNEGWLFSSNTSIAFNVPEPSTLALVGLALLGVGFRKGRRQAR